MKLLVNVLIVVLVILWYANFSFAITNDNFFINHSNYEFSIPMSFLGDDAVLMFYGPTDNVNFNIIIQSEPNRNLEEYTKFSKEQVQQIPDFKIEKESYETYNGNKFAVAVNSFKKDNVNFKSKGMWTIYNKKAYVLTYTATDDIFDKYLKDAENIFKSFKISPCSISIPKEFTPDNNLIMVFGETTQNFRINFNIIVNKITQKTLEEFTEFSKAEAKKIPGFEIIKEGYETYNKVKFYTATQKLMQNNIKLMAKSIWTVNNQKAYIITYTSTENEYPKYEKEINELCKSFKIK